MIRTYRTDIDGLRAIAIISVLLFHLGYLPNGYLGVDVFFVISGYLITGIAFSKIEENRFSIFDFYERRVRRIIPLILLTTLVALLFGLKYMLPDDLENLSQSVFASNIMANNILMKITSADYWAVRNEYKPLMHTWSLGVEEQFYLLYPIMFYSLKGSKSKFILPSLIGLTSLSLLLFYTSSDSASKFYFLHYRFFELSIGGIGAIAFGKSHRLNSFKKSQHILFLLLAALLALLLVKNTDNNDLKILFTSILTAGILVLGRLHFESNFLYKAILSNKLLAGIGKMSFSIYMWHQIVFAFARYSFLDSIRPYDAFYLSIITILLSAGSYFAIERTFRNRSLIRTKPLLLITGISWTILLLASLYVYLIGGIIKDVPELGLKKVNIPSNINFFSGKNNIHIQYNELVRSLDKPFSSHKEGSGPNQDKIRILVVGNSLGRDVANILLESSFRDAIEVRYTNLAGRTDPELKQRIAEADYIFFGSYYPTSQMKENFSLDMNKVWIVGTKDFGVSNGRHYNRKIQNYSAYRTEMKEGVMEINQRLKREWGTRYIDLIELVADSEGRVLVFTPGGKFISQDTIHFTKFGAVFFAELLEKKFREIMNITGENGRGI